MALYDKIALVCLAVCGAGFLGFLRFQPLALKKENDFLEEASAFFAASRLKSAKTKE